MKNNIRSNFDMLRGQMHADLGFVAGKPPRDAAFSPALEAEPARLRAFLMPRSSVR